MSFFLRRVFFGIVLSLTGIFHLPAQALTSRFTTLYNVPAMAESDFITTMGSHVISQKEFRAFSQIDYAYHPLELTNAGSRVRGIVDHLAVQNLGVAFSLIPGVEFETLLPVILFNRFSTPDVVATNFKNKFSIGDLLFRTRLRILKKQEHWLGLGLVPWLSLPTGNENLYTADRRPTGGIFAVLDKDFAKKFSVGLNLGAMARERVVFLDYTTQFMLQGSLGARAQWLDWLSTEVDFYTRTKVKRAFREQVSSPTEALAQLGFKIPHSKLQLGIGGGFSLMRGAGVPLFRSFVGLSYGAAPLPAFEGTGLPHSSY